MVRINRAITAAGATLLAVGFTLSGGHPAMAEQPDMFRPLSPVPKKVDDPRGDPVISGVGVQVNPGAAERCPVMPGTNERDYTVVVKEFHDANGDKINDDPEPKGMPGGTIKFQPGNPVATWWYLHPDVFAPQLTPGDPNYDPSISFGGGMTGGLPGDPKANQGWEMNELQLIHPVLTSGLYVVGGVCVTNRQDDPSNPTADSVMLDSSGHPIGTWFVVKLDVVDRNRTAANPAKYLMDYTPWSDGAVRSPSATASSPSPSSPSPTPTASASSPTTGQPTTSTPGPAPETSRPVTTTPVGSVTSTGTASPGAVTVTIPGPTQSVTVSVPGPTVSITVPGPTATVSVTVTASSDRPTGSPVPMESATATEGATTQGYVGTQSPLDATVTPTPGNPGSTNPAGSSNSEARTTAGGYQTSGPLARTGADTTGPVLMGVGALLLGTRLLRRC